jgi:hypothetical protein
MLRRAGQRSAQGTLPVIKRPHEDAAIRKTMLIRNNFFTSTVMFRRHAAIAVGGFVRDSMDLGEDYDLWLRLGTQGRMHNFTEPLDIYRVPIYSREKFRQFLRKQLTLISRYKQDYPYYWLSWVILRFRIAIGSRARFAYHFRRSPGTSAAGYQSVSG